MIRQKGGLNPSDEFGYVHRISEVDLFAQSLVVCNSGIGFDSANLSGSAAARICIGGTRRICAMAPETFRHLSPSIALKRNFLAVDLTVSSAYPQ